MASLGEPSTPRRSWTFSRMPQVGTCTPSGAAAPVLSFVEQGGRLRHGHDRRGTVVGHPNLSMMDGPPLRARMRRGWPSTCES